MEDTGKERLIELALACVDLEGEERKAYLDENCESDDVRRDVEAWLARTLPTLQPQDGLLASAVEFAKPLDEVTRAAGDTIGKFRLVERIAEGGSGVVWRARQLDIDRDAAVKLLRPHRKGSAASQRFHRETAVLARVSHPAIAQIYAVGAEEIDAATELPWFAMEFVPGKTTLVDYCNANRTPRDERLRLFVRVCDAVAHSHALGVIHRDLKPDNILVAPAGHPKVIDFGAARDLEATQSLTQAGTLIGTLDWMSPEQAQSDDDHALDARTDVYALGAVLHLLLTGHKLVTLSGYADITKLIVERVPEPASRFDPSLPRELDWIIGKATDPEPDRRYPGVDALISDVERHLAGDIVLAAPPTLGYTLTRLVNRHRALATVIAVALVVTTSLAVFGWTTALEKGALANQERSAREDAEDAEEDARANLVQSLLANAATLALGGHWPDAISTLEDALKNGAKDPVAVKHRIARNRISNLEHAKAAQLLDDIAGSSGWEAHKHTHALLRGLTALVDEEEREFAQHHFRASIAEGSALSPADLAFAQGLVAGSSGEATARFTQALEIDRSHYFARSARALVALVIDDVDAARRDATVLAETIPHDRIAIIFPLRQACYEHDDVAYEQALRDIEAALPPEEFALIEILGSLFRGLDAMILASTKGEGDIELIIKRIAPALLTASMNANALDKEVLLGPVGIHLPWLENLTDMARALVSSAKDDLDEAIAIIDDLRRGNESHVLALTRALLVNLKGLDAIESRIDTWTETLEVVQGDTSYELICLMGIAHARANAWVRDRTTASRSASAAAIDALSRRDDLTPHVCRLLTEMAWDIDHGDLGYYFAWRWEELAPDDPAPLWLRAHIGLDVGHSYAVLETLERLYPLIEGTPLLVERWNELHARAVDGTRSG